MSECKYGCGSRYKSLVELEAHEKTCRLNPVDEGECLAKKEVRMSESKCRICGATEGYLMYNQLTGEHTCQECTKQGRKDQHQKEIEMLQEKIEQLEKELARIKDGLCEHCECSLFHEQPCHCCNDE